MATIEQAFEIPNPAVPSKRDIKLNLTVSVDPEIQKLLDQLKIPNPAYPAIPESTEKMTIQSIANWFVEAVPTPTDKNKAVQLGCHFEEVSEMFDAIGEPAFAQKLSQVGDHYKKVATDVTVLDRKELLDSLCDQIVTAVGVAHMLNLNIQGALAEVNRSNYSKFVNGKPVFDTNGKIAKPASYSKPDLTPFIGN